MVQAEVIGIHKNKPFLLNILINLSFSLWLNCKNRVFEEKINKINQNLGNIAISNKVQLKSPLIHKFLPLLIKNYFNLNDFFKLNHEKMIFLLHQSSINADLR